MKIHTLPTFVNATVSDLEMAGPIFSSKSITQKSIADLLKRDLLNIYLYSFCKEIHTNLVECTSVYSVIQKSCSFIAGQNFSKPELFCLC